VVEILPAGRRVPVRILLQQFNVEAVQAARGLDVKGIFADLFDRARTAGEGFSSLASLTRHADGMDVRTDAIHICEESGGGH
jgi:hypothetical protein